MHHRPIAIKERASQLKNIRQLHQSTYKHDKKNSQCLAGVIVNGEDDTDRHPPNFMGLPVMHFQRLKKPLHYRMYVPTDEIEAPVLEKVLRYFVERKGLLVFQLPDDSLGCLYVHPDPEFYYEDIMDMYTGKLQMALKEQLGDKVRDHRLNGQLMNHLITFLKYQAGVDLGLIPILFDL